MPRRTVTRAGREHVLEDVSSFPMEAAQDPGSCDWLRGGGTLETCIYGCSSVIQERH